MNTHFTSAQLVQRPAHSQLDSMAINIGDIVYLKPANGLTIRATVIFNAQIDGIITYTTDRVQPCADGVMPAAVGQRIRFCHERVHYIEPFRRAQQRVTSDFHRKCSAPRCMIHPLIEAIPSFKG